MNKMSYTVYMHISPSNKRYIGITCKKPEYRWNNGKGYKNNKYFSSAINRYGWNNFQHIIIARGLTKEEAMWLEIELIREWDTINREVGYNITEGGEGTRGINPLENMTEEARQEWKRKQSESKKGKSNWDGASEEFTEEWKRKISEATKGENNPMYGKDWREGKTEEEMKVIGRKISEAIGGRNHPQIRSIICLTTNTVFYTIKEGAEFYNIKSSSHISSCCNGDRKSCGKYNGQKLVWMYLNDFLNLCKYTIL